MRPSARKALRSVSRLTAPLCASCPEPAGVYPDLPYMGRSGCVVPPELRPGCTGFVCPSALGIGSARKRDRFIRRALSDPEVAAMWEAGSAHCREHLADCFK